MGRGVRGRAGWSLIVAALLASCGIDEPPPQRGLLEPLHGSVDPATLTATSLVRGAAPPTTSPGQEWRVASVSDGRTLELYRGLERVTVLLGGITVPLGEECQAQEAADSVRFITGGGRPVTVRPDIGGGRTRVGGVTLYTSAGDDLAEVVLSLGLARHDGGGRDPVEYAAAEAAARDDGVGIWSGDCTDE